MGSLPVLYITKRGCTRLAATSNKVYQLLAHGRWFSPGTPASSTIKTGRHDIAEILLKVALNTINQIKSNHFSLDTLSFAGAVVFIIRWYLFIQLPVQSVPITTKVESSNLDQGEVSSIQHYVIKFVSDL
jgi:hypothetical protein